MCVRKCKPLFGQAFLIEIRNVVGGVEFSGWQPGHQELPMGKSETRRGLFATTEPILSNVFILCRVVVFLICLI